MEDYLDPQGPSQHAALPPSAEQHMLVVSPEDNLPTSLTAHQSHGPHRKGMMEPTDEI